MTIGLPQALSYYYYKPLWTTFFHDLGCDLVMSGQTDRSKLDSGINIAPSETCLPLKCYIGHLLSLIGKTDCIFVPRLACLKTHPWISLGCPKMIGLPDMVKALVPEANILSINIDLRREMELASYMKLGKDMGFRDHRVRQAFEHATEDLTQYRKERIAQIHRPLGSSGSLRIGILGHAYLLYDDFLNLGLMKKTRQAGARVVNCHELGELIEDLPNNIKPLSWYFENHILCAAQHFYNDKSISGIIYLCSFGCGAASITYEVIDSEIGRAHSTHFLRIVLDEHTGETGMATRVESFVDMINLKKEKRL